MSQMPSSMSTGVQPHRGTMILVLGILGIVLCVICGIVAWIMANADLRAMQAGQMDRSGEGLTKAGKICGIVSVILNVIGIALWLLMVIVFGAAAAAAGAAGGGTP